jgi:hypothetical protein
MSNTSLEDLAQNVLNDPSADATAKLIAKMAESQGLVLNAVMRVEGEVRRLHHRADVIVNELERAFDRDVRPDFNKIRFRQEEEGEEPASNGHG